MALRRDTRLALLSTSLTPMIWATGFYVTFVWMSIIMEDLLESSIQNAFWINSVDLALGMAWILRVAGAFFDRIGWVSVMTISGLFLMGLGPVFLVLIAKGNALAAFFSQSMLGLILSFYGAPLCAWLVENFSPGLRLTSASMGYDISHAIAGGFSPAMATALHTNVGVNAAGLINFVFGAISVSGIFIHYWCGGSGSHIKRWRQRDPSSPRPMMLWK